MKLLPNRFKFGQKNAVEEPQLHSLIQQLEAVPEHLRAADSSAI